jgi:hypothetical protein
VSEPTQTNPRPMRSRIARLVAFSVVGGLAGFAVSYLFGVMGST